MPWTSCDRTHCSEALHDEVMAHEPISPVDGPPRQANTGLADPGGASAVREIPFNYTSAGDRQAVSFLLGAEAVQILDELRGARVTGRSARILLRVFGEVLIHRRNPYLYEELVSSAQRRKRFFGNTAKDLEILASKAEGDPRVLDILGGCRELLKDFRNEVEG